MTEELPFVIYNSTFYYSKFLFVNKGNHWTFCKLEIISHAILMFFIGYLCSIVNNKPAYSFLFQYCYWKQMAKAATLIQNKYRLYCEHKRFKKSQQAATCIQNYYRNYKEHQNQTRSRMYEEKESTPTTGIK